ncbi:LacI family DNA-binding transcriptional regulator [Paenibacillus fonticola]|uniref:LacI family DNA-binding transcriptional regulator n=1 Tax=Paenibacillus fonticola TaxID=379896 RepID=UPI000368CA2C|nr:LacI family DNA-binding transcriptional regulator [Paenibacillus fonticola]
MSRVTIKDVAQKSGMSIRTVSRVINNDPHVKDKTRVKVQAVIEELGFKVNILARSLKEMKTNQIVVFIDRRKGMYWGTFHNEFLHELHRVMKKQGYRMVISPSSPDSFEEDENDGFYLVKNGMCDGAIMFDPNIGDKRIAYLKDISVPFVVIGKDVSRFDTSYVDVDNQYVGYFGAKTIHSYGYEDFVLLLGSEGSPINQDRAAGFQQYCLEQDIKSKHIYGLSDLESVYQQSLRQIQSEGTKAIFVSGDERALAVYRAIYESGYRVGEDIGVLGVDDIRTGEYMFPALSTIGQPKRDIAELALSMLIEQIHSEDPAAKRTLVAPTIIHRSSLVKQK